MEFPIFVYWFCCAVCCKLALSCPPVDSLRHENGKAYLGSCSRIGRHSEQWTIKIDFTLGPGENLPTRRDWALPTPESGFWLTSAYLEVTDRAETQRFIWPPVHVHHIACRSSQAAVWYDQDVYEHAEAVVLLGGAGAMDERLKRYTVLNASDGWGSYYPTGTRVRCQVRIDDDRLNGEKIQYRLLLHLSIFLDSHKLFNFQSFGVNIFEGTTTGQNGYNIPAGPVTVVSKDYRAPRAGSFQPETFIAHTHPGAKSMQLIAKRLGGHDFIEPQCLLTLEHPSMTIKSGLQSQNLNVKPGVYIRPPIKKWSKIGLSWYEGKLNTSGASSSRSCAFQEGDIFYTKSIHVAPNPTINTMMVMGATVFWNEPPPANATFVRLRYGGIIRNQLFDTKEVPHDLLAGIPRRLTRSSLYGLHRKMPLLFCHPDRLADRKHVHCLRNATNKVLATLYSVKDLDENMLATLQKHC